MGRTIAWRGRCPSEVHHILGTLASSGLLVVQQPGPTSFVLKDSDAATSTASVRKFKVNIGDVHSCTCRGKFAPSGQSFELCQHILFVLSKIFRLPADNPLVWQQSLLEAEIDQLVKGQISAKARRGIGKTVQSDANTPVQRRPLEEEDECPICCDVLNDERPLVYCRFGCGNSIHSSCFKQYTIHNSTNPSPLLCPYCRVKWGALVSGPSHGVSCAECKAPINGDRYRCAFCTSYDLCTTCFQCPMIHAQHPFNFSTGPGLAMHPATRPEPRQHSTVPVPSQASATPVMGDAAFSDLMSRDLGPEDYEALLALDTHNVIPEGALLTQEDVQMLRKSQWRDQRGDSQDQDVYDSCAICMDNFILGCEIVHLPLCNHVFHIECASQWLMNCKAVCPIDNQPVPAMASRSDESRSALDVRANTTTTRAGRTSSSTAAQGNVQQMNRRRGTRETREAARDDRRGGRVVPLRRSSAPVTDPTPPVLDLAIVGASGFVPQRPVMAAETVVGDDAPVRRSATKRDGVTPTSSSSNTTGMAPPTVFHMRQQTQGIRNSSAPALHPSAQQPEQRQVVRRQRPPQATTTRTTEHPSPASEGGEFRPTTDDLNGLFVGLSATAANVSGPTPSSAGAMVHRPVRRVKAPLRR